MNLLPTSAAKSALCASLFAVLSIGLPLDAAASAIRTDAAFTANTLARNDDGSTGLVNISFEVCFFGRVLTQLYVNNNGNVTFLAPLSQAVALEYGGHCCNHSAAVTASVIRIMAIISNRTKRSTRLLISCFLR